MIIHINSIAKSTHVHRTFDSVSYLYRILCVISSLSEMQTQSDTHVFVRKECNMFAIYLLLKPGHIMFLCFSVTISFLIKIVSCNLAKITKFLL